MERVFKIILIPFATLLILSSATTKNEIMGGSKYYYQFVNKDDSIELISMVQVDSFKLPVVPPSSGVQYYKNGIIFLSLSKYEEKMSPTHLSFGATETYYATVEDTVTGMHTVFSQLSSFSYPCEAMTFNPNYNTMYFTKISGKDKKEKIFMAKYVSNSKNQKGWISEKSPLDFCNDSSNYTHPALSSDEKMIVFASDREGTEGSMDLFISRKTDDKWSAPENLGNYINTTGNEFFPFLDSENNLFFSSDGLQGYGGYDIYTSKFNGETWGKPKNLSDRINSENDDIAFTINKMDGKTAFFTRRQKSAKSNMQLFRVTLKKEIGYRNLLTISYIFNGKPRLKTNLTAVNNPMKANPEEIKPLISQPKNDALSKKPDTTRLSEHIIVPEQKKTVFLPATPEINEKTDSVVYRVQFAANITSKGKFQITVANKTYDTFEYFYQGAFRYTIGKFDNVKTAAELQNACRQSGYQQAFVVAFKNNTRSLDLKLFK